MKRKKGDLPGRYVNAHLRKWPNHPGEYVDVAAYQEKVSPAPSNTIADSPQGEFELIAAPKDSQNQSETEENDPQQPIATASSGFFIVELSNRIVRPNVFAICSDLPRCKISQY
jgi:hypothetical protein